MLNLGTTELLIVLAIVLLLFGGPRLPKLARSLGEASKEFKSGVDDEPAPIAVPETGKKREETQSAKRRRRLSRKRGAIDEPALAEEEGDPSEDPGEEAGPPGSSPAA